MENRNNSNGNLNELKEKISQISKEEMLANTVPAFMSMRDARRFGNRIPDIKMLDLTVACYYKPDDGAWVLIDSNLAWLKDITKEDLVRVTAEYIVNGECAVKPLVEVMREMCGMPEEFLPYKNYPLYIGSPDSIRGAIHMMNMELMSEIANEVEDDLLILPSSVHEVLVLPKNSVELNGLVEFITEINETTVEPEDRLSNHPYYFSREKKEVYM